MLLLIVVFGTIIAQGLKEGKAGPMRRTEVKVACGFLLTLRSVSNGGTRKATQ